MAQTQSPPQRSRLIQIAQVIGVVILVLWAVEIIDAFILDDSLEARGIVPRSLGGLQGIALAPVLHDDFGHLLANTLPLVLLGALLLSQGFGRWAAATGIIVVVGGGLTWLLAREANHIGASGVVFGYLAYLLAAGFFERSARAIIAGVVAFLLYGGLLFGVLPGRPGVSWESHLFGAVAGVLAAWVLSRAGANEAS